MQQSRSPIKVVSDRLGHAHPAFTMHTYQPAPRHERSRRRPVRRPHRHRHPVDVYGDIDAKTQVSGLRCVAGSAGEVMVSNRSREFVESSSDGQSREGINAKVRSGLV